MIKAHFVDQIRAYWAARVTSTRVLYPSSPTFDGFNAGRFRQLAESAVFHSASFIMCQEECFFGSCVRSLESLYLCSATIFDQEERGSQGSCLDRCPVVCVLHAKGRGEPEKVVSRLRATLLSELKEVSFCATLGPSHAFDLLVICLRISSDVLPPQLSVVHFSRIGSSFLTRLSAKDRLVVL